MSRQAFRTVCLIFALLALAWFAAGCDADDDDDNNDAADDDDDDNDDDDNGADDDSAGDDDDDQGTAPFCAIDSDEIDLLIGQMSLRQKVAQLFYVGVDIFPWFNLPDAERAVRDIQVGGVHMSVALTLGFWPEWTVRNTNELQRLAMLADPGIPLITGIDQEGGIPQAFNQVMGGTDTPGNMGLGATFDPQATFDSYDLTAGELHSLGINTNLAPVLEVMTDHLEVSMYTRCFGEDTDEVAKHAFRAVRATQQRLVAATAKHFPGQSAAPGDEHYSLPVAEQSEEEMRAIYLPPFEAAIAAGVDVIMSTHARFAAWGGDLPASLNPAILTGLLREDLGFEGLIVTDDLNMGGISLGEWPEAPVVMALLAGADMLMDIFDDFQPTGTDDQSPYPTDLEGEIDTILDAIDTGVLTEERINQSVRRILRLKMKYCMFEDRFRAIDTAGDNVRTPENVATSMDLHRRAITLVRDDDGLLPLDPDDDTRVHVVTTFPVVWEMFPEATWPTMSMSGLIDNMRAIKPSVTGAVFNSQPRSTAIDQLVQGAQDSDADVLVIGTYNALYDEPQTELVQRLLDVGIPTVIVAQAMPYDLLAFPDATTYVALYSNRDLALAAGAKALFGLTDMPGRLPVSLPGMYEVGWSAAAE